MFNVQRVGVEVWFYHDGFEEIVIGTIVGIRRDNGHEIFTITHKQGSDDVKVFVDSSKVIFPE